MNVLDLFSGIGGFSLGLERAGMRTIAFCEIDPYCRAVLAKHWPDVPVHGDIRTLDAATVDACAARVLTGRPEQWPERERVGASGQSIDLVCGGFPCQPFSHAGKRKGAADDRHLWPEMARVISEVRPAWVVGENVAGLVSMGLDLVLSDLEGMGYAVQTFCIPACAVDAPHRRDRLWIVAHADHTEGERQRQHGRPLLPEQASVRSFGGGDVPDRDEQGLEKRQRKDAIREREGGRAELERGYRWLPEPDVGRVVARLSSRMDGVGLNDADASEGNIGKILRTLRDGHGAHALQWTARGQWGLPAAEVLFAAVCEYTGAPRTLGNISLAGSATSPLAMRGLWFDGKIACASCRRSAAEQRAREHPDPLLLVSSLLACNCGATWLDRTGSTGSLNRVSRLKALGNAVVPQAVEAIGRAIMMAEAEHEPRRA